MQLKYDLDDQQIHFWGQFVEHRLMLSSSFRCNQIYKYEIHDFGHTVVLVNLDLDVQQTCLCTVVPYNVSQRLNLKKL